ncbi:radical SAM protein [Ruegeria sp. HKCCD8929]|uniref:radical SAM protein n=1 Tax=Ruegeria sp. HKCCD8929 TaxID=2683006 RepID=UPI001489709C|nr:radical SAM protein [Ruegeria sp. HKCCD8929]
MNALQIYLYNLQRRCGPREHLCYSPSTSLFFGTDGKVTSCCYNRETVLGRYPKNTIREIWQGRPRHSLCQSIAANDLSGGCVGCGSQIEVGNYGAVVAQHSDRWSVDPDHPTSFSFELHNTCNLECIMCNGDLSSRIRRYRDRLPAKRNVYDAAFVNQLEDFIPHLEGTTFYGGEPFLMRLYYRIWDRLIALNPECEIMVQTNASILSDRVHDFLERGNFHLGVSLDSVHPATYASIRRNADYDAVIANTRWMADYSRHHGRSFGISACMMTTNWQELPELLEFADELDAVLYFNTVWEPRHLSLAYSQPALIQQVAERYGTLALHRGLSAATHGRAQAASTANLAGFIALLGTWHQAALRREQDVAVAIS